LCLIVIDFTIKIIYLYLMFEDFFSSIEEVSELRNLIEGKRICICGPSPNTTGKKLGEKIDNYDLVCRISFHLPINEDHKIDIGTRSDIILSGANNVYMDKLRFPIINYDKEGTLHHEAMKDTKYIYFVDPIIDAEYRKIISGWADKPNDVTWNEFTERFSNDKIKYGSTTSRIDYKWRTLAFKKYNYDINSNKAMSNTGMSCIAVILKHNPKELFITGMNFYNWGKGVIGKGEIYSKGIGDHWVDDKKGPIARGKLVKGHIIDNLTLNIFKDLILEYKDVITVDDDIKENLLS
jgi:hypothetical protein